MERAESTARVLQVTAALAIDSDLIPQQCWLPVVIIAGEREGFAKECGEDALGDGEAVQEYLVFGKAPVSLEQSIAAARENARSIREVISLEIFESINELHLWIQSPRARLDFDEHRYGFYRHVRRETQLGLGLGIDYALLMVSRSRSCASRFVVFAWLMVALVQCCVSYPP